MSGSARFWPRSIRFRLTAWHAGLLTLVMLGFALYTYQSLQYFMHIVLTDSLERRARQIGQTMLESPVAPSQDYLRTEVEARYAPSRNDRFIRIAREGEAPLYVSTPPIDRSFSPEEVGPAPRLEKGVQSRVVRMRNGGELLVVGVPFASGGRRYVIEVGSPLASAQRVLRAQAMALLAGLGVVLALAILGGHILMKRALHPVESLMNAAEEISLHQLSRRLPFAETGDEIESLARALNRMLARLEEAFQHASRFTTDASHELRTPLTVLRGELEALLSRKEPAANLRPALASILEEVERLVKIVEGLFSLSRLDAGEAQTERVRLDLSQLVATTAEQMCLLAEEKQIALTCETPAPVEVEGDRARLKQVVVNLLDNAIKYTPEKGRVTLRVSRQNGSALLEVSDTGPGVPAAALPHLFERFFRGAEARSKEIDGAGLGLSIVQSICAAHGGSVAAANQPPQGCVFTVTLPAARSNL